MNSLSSRTSTARPPKRRVVNQPEAERQRAPAQRVVDDLTRGGRVSEEGRGAFCDGVRTCGFLVRTAFGAPRRRDVDCHGRGARQIDRVPVAPRCVGAPEALGSSYRGVDDGQADRGGLAYPRRRLTGRLRPSTSAEIRESHPLLRRSSFNRGVRPVGR